MKAMSLNTLFVFVLIASVVLLSYAADTNNVTNLTESSPIVEYVQLFSSIPSLFEHILEMLQSKPEVLEKNDPTIFQLDDGGHIAERSVKQKREEQSSTPMKTEETKPNDVIQDNNETEEKYPDYDNKDDNTNYRYVASLVGGQFSLSPEEVADKAIIVEQMLEEYNSSKNKK